jgi:hypothetical protein
VHRPDGAWSLLLVNKDPHDARSVRVTFRGAAGADTAFAGDVDEATFDAAHYVWHPDGPNGHADPDGPIVRTRQRATEAFMLPAASVTVLRGSVR